MPCNQKQIIKINYRCTSFLFNNKEESKQRNPTSKLQGHQESSVLANTRHYTTAKDNLPVFLNELQAPCDNLVLTRKLDDIYPPIDSCYRLKICQITKDACRKMNEDGGQNFRAKRKH